MRRLTYTILVLICCVRVLAQENTIAVEFTTLSWERTDDTIFFQSSGSSPESITLNTRMRSGPYRYIGQNPIVFFTESENADGESIHVPVATVTIPLGMQHALLFFVRPNDKSRMTVYVMDDSPKAFPPGSVRFFNMTDRDLGVLFNDEKIPMHPRDVKTIAVSGEPMRANLAILAIRDEALRDIYHAQWGHSNRSRYLVFIKDSEMRLDGVEIKTIPEHFPVE